jgi:hypothetical protein
MSRKKLWVVLSLLVFLGLAGGVLTGYLPAALAQGEAPAAATDVTKILAPSPVVAAIPYQTRTDYEQDPFEPARVRRTHSTVVRVLLVRQDGTTEIKAGE